MHEYPPNYDVTEVHPLVKEYVNRETGEEAAMGLMDATAIIASLMVSEELGATDEERRNAGMRILDLATVGLLVEGGIIPLAPPNTSRQTAEEREKNPT